MNKYLYIFMLILTMFFFLFGNELGMYYLLWRNYDILVKNTELYQKGYAEGYSAGTTYGMQAERYWINLNPDNNK